MSDPKSEQQQLQVKVSDEVLKGVYSNMVQIGHTQEEFILDFLNIFPPAGSAVARVMVSPAHAKRLASALVENIKKYEEQFGEVKLNVGQAVPTINTTSDHKFGFDTNKAV